MLIQVDDLTIGYKQNGGIREVFNNMNAGLHSGELTCLLGPNGAGKSTLLKTMSGFLAPLGGKIEINGVAINKLSDKKMSKLVSVVLTEKCDVKNVTVEELVGFGRSPYTGFWGKLQSDDLEVIEKSLRQVGIIHMRNRLLQNLSDGEKQKVMIAKALVQDTPVIFLDEPTAFLDLPSKIEIMQLLRKISMETGKVIFLSTHDLELALQIADKIWLLSQEKGFMTGSPEDLMLSDELGGFFNREGITFDKYSGLFKIMHEHHSSIQVLGNDLEFSMLHRALSRNGIEVTRQDESGIKVEVSGNGSVEYSVFDGAVLVSKVNSVGGVVREVVKCLNVN